MSRFISSTVYAATLLTLATATQAAGFGVDATRLIYPQGDASISTTIRNTETSTPYLVKADISRSVVYTKTTAFDVIPPLVRLNPGSTNQLRIIARDVSQLPSDRESVFWFRTTAIPASQQLDTSEQTGHTQGAVRFGVGTIIKLFYRPTNLPGSSHDAQRGLKFARTVQGIQVSNPSPYFVSFASVRVGEKKLPLSTPEQKMIAPFGSYTWTVSGATGTVKWKTINDGGGTDAFSQKLP
jgi:fimbrial chaperone protein